MNECIVSDIQDLNQLINWLHDDIDHSLDGAELEVIDNYSRMFRFLADHRDALKSNASIHGVAI